MSDRTWKWVPWLLALAVSLMPLLTGCDLPAVSAEDRLFLNLKLDFLGDYQLPKQDFEGTRVGGLSALTYDRRHDRVYALSDDRSELAPARFYTLKLQLDRTAPSPKLQLVDLEAVTVLKQENGQPYAKGTIDPEGLALSPLGTVFVSSEGVTHSNIPPFVREFDRQTGQWRRSLNIPTTYIPDAAGEQQTRGIRDNLGFEALTITPGGYGSTVVEPFRLFTATESALKQDVDPTTGADSERNSRLLHYLLDDRKGLLVSEHLYKLDPPPDGAISHGLTELLAIDQGGHFLSLERSFGLKGFTVKLFQLAMGSATDTTTIAKLVGSLKGVEPIQKKLLLDLTQLGIPLDNLEGMTIGPRLPDGSQSLLLVSDDNFRQEQVTQFLLFRLTGLS